MLALLVILTVLQIITADPIHISRVQTRTSYGIHGGDPALIEEFPHEVVIEYCASVSCAGSIISEQYIVTTAVCAKNIKNFYDEIVIRSGSSYPNRNGTEHKADKIIIHEKYADEKAVNNIALVRVSQPFEFDETRQPIQLVEQDEETPVGASGIVSGWGETDDSSEEDGQLQKLNVTVTDHDECKEMLPVGVDEGVICAKNDENKGKTVCDGDWGDSLVIDGRLAGILSWTLVGCPGEYPTGYTSVAYYRNWIDEHMQ